MRVSCTEFVKKFGQFKNQVYREPIELMSHNVVAAYVISPDDFNELQELRKLARRNLLAGKLPEDIVEALKSAKMPSDHDGLNALMGK